MTTDMDTLDQAESQKAKRPLGVWILTIWDALFAGLIPFAAAFVAYFNEDARAALEMSVFSLALSVLLGGAVIAAAIGAWQGKNGARIALVILVTIHHSMIALNNAVYAATGAFSDSRMETQAWARVFRSIFWIGINIWYFFGKRPREFYGKSSQ